MRPVLKRTADSAMQLLIATLVVTGIAFVVTSYGPELKARMSGWFAPALSRVDRAEIAGCLRILKSTDAPEAKVPRLAALRCDRFSDSQIAQVAAEEKACWDNPHTTLPQTQDCVWVVDGYADKPK
jgi:hypothetical protein